MTADSVPPLTQEQSPGTSNSPSLAAKRVCRQLVVEASAVPSGVHACLICKVVLLASTAAHDSVHLLDSAPLTTLSSAEAYSLPLRYDDPPIALESARKLGLQLPSPLEAVLENGQPKQGMHGDAHSRRRRSVASSRSAALAAVRRGASLAIEQEGQEIVLRRRPSDPKHGSASTEEAGAEDDSLESDQGGTGGEYLVVLHLNLAFGRLQLPLFANSVSIPTPLCLRNTLTLTLPSPPSESAFSAWDLSVRPSLSNAASILHTASSAESTQITGNFPSTPALSLRWGPQLAADSIAQLAVPHAITSTAWTVDDIARLRAEVKVQADFEYAGLRDKQWVEVDVTIPALEVLDCVGSGATNVLDWHLASSVDIPPSSSTTGPATTPAVPPAKPVSRKASGSSLGLGNAPTSALALSAARRRRSSARAGEARPPSFHSLFDTAMPAPPVLDTSFTTDLSASDLLDQSRRKPSSSGRDLIASTTPEAGRDKEASLLSQAAPFDPEASAMDMSFEVASLHDSDSEAGAESAMPDYSSESAVSHDLAASGTSSTRVRIQLDLGSSLRAFAVEETAERPTFAFQLVFTALSSSAHPTDRVAIPSISFATAQSEDGLVTVSGAYMSDKTSIPSAMTLADGSVRWTTSRRASIDQIDISPPVHLSLGPSSRDSETANESTITTTVDATSLMEETPLAGEVSFGDSFDPDASFATVVPETSAPIKAEEESDAVTSMQPPQGVPDHASAEAAKSAATTEQEATTWRAGLPVLRAQEDAVLPKMTSTEATAQEYPAATEKRLVSRDFAVQTISPKIVGSSVQTTPPTTAPAPPRRPQRRSSRRTEDSLVKSLTRLLFLVTLTLIGTQLWHYLRGGHASPFARYRSRHAHKYPLRPLPSANTIVSYKWSTTTMTETVHSTLTHVATITSVSTTTEHRTVTSLHTLVTPAVAPKPTPSPPRPSPIYSDDFTAATPATPISTLVPPHTASDRQLAPNEARTVAANFVIWLHSVRLEVRTLLSRWREWIRL